MNRKVKISYYIRPELDERLAAYARANGKTRTDIITSIIEKHLSCKKLSKKINEQNKKKPVQRKNWMEWKRKGDYIFPSQHSKIKFIAINGKISISEVMDDILGSYLSKVNPSETLEEALEKVFG